MTEATPHAEPLLVYVPRWKAVLRVGMSLAMAAGSLWMTGDNDSFRLPPGTARTVLGWCGFALFGPGTVLFGLQSLNRRPYLRIDTRGITQTRPLRLRTSFLPWNEYASTATVAGPFLAVYSTSGKAAVSIDEGMIPMSAAELADEIERWARRCGGTGRPPRRG